jgi:hypothetical protein
MLFIFEEEATRFGEVVAVGLAEYILLLVFFD